MDATKSVKNWAKQLREIEEGLSATAQLLQRDNSKYELAPLFNAAEEIDMVASDLEKWLLAPTEAEYDRLPKEVNNG